MATLSQTMGSSMPAYGTPARTALAASAGITSGYTGTAAQNAQIVSYLNSSKSSGGGSSSSSSFQQAFDALTPAQKIAYTSGGGTYGIGGQQYTYSNGQFVPAGTISVDTVNNPPAPIKKPSPAVPINYESQINVNNAGLGVLPKGITTPVQPITPAVQPKTSSESLLEEYLTGTKDAATKYREEVRQAEIDRANALQQKQQVINNLSGQLGVITADATAKQLAVTGQGRGIPEVIIGGQQAQIAKEAAIQALPIQAQLSIAQNDLAQAQTHLDTLYKIRTDDARANLDYETAKIGAVYNYATNQQKLALDKLEKEQANATNQLTKSIDYARSISEKLLSTNPKLASSIAAINPPNISSKTFTQDLENYNSRVASLMSSAGGTGGAKGGVLSSLPTSIQGKLISQAEKFGSSDIVKKYNATVDSINIVNGIDTATKNPADHQTIVYAFAKSLDPDSVVREGEYATIKKYAQSTLNKFSKEITNAINGTGFLSKEAIENIKTTMNNNYMSRKPQFDNAYSEAKRIVNNIAGTDIADEIFIDYSKGVTSSAGTKTAMEGDTKNWQGVVYKVINGVWTPQ